MRPLTLIRMREHARRMRTHVRRWKMAYVALLVVLAFAVLGYQSAVERATEYLERDIYAPVSLTK